MTDYCPARLLIRGDQFWPNEDTDELIHKVVKQRRAIYEVVEVSDVSAQNRVVVTVTRLVSEYGGEVGTRFSLTYTHDHLMILTNMNRDLLRESKNMLWEILNAR